MRKTLRREDRIRSAKEWIKNYSGKNIVRGYSKEYAVDRLCAVIELRLIGVEVSEHYENQLRLSLEALRLHRLSVKRKHENELNTLSEFDCDENFAMIIRYTSGGFPFGVTQEEMDKINIKNEFKYLSHPDQISIKKSQNEYAINFRKMVS